jgi:hypothetical protein
MRIRKLFDDDVTNTASMEDVDDIDARTYQAGVFG